MYKNLCLITHDNVREMIVVTYSNFIFFWNVLNLEYSNLESVFFCFPYNFIFVYC